MNLCSSLERPTIIDQLTTQTFDLAIIGGGITGLGIALDAASRGMKVALVEKGDFASGTSSKSTKLIHGGLRYLKQFQIGVVREVGKERAVVHHLAPHLVVSEKMLLPLVKNGTYGEWATSLGLWFYDMVAGVDGPDKRKMLSKEETTKSEPLLRTDIVTGGGIYAEYRTDDARLSIEVLKTALQYGAIALNYAEVIDFEYDKGALTALHCKGLSENKDFEIKAHFIVNATGPWVDKLRKLDNSLKGKHLFLSKGVHIVVPYDRLPLRQSVYFDTPDGRMVFAIPRMRTTYIGTTDTPYQGPLENVPVDKKDVLYLLDAVNFLFPSVQLKLEDVESTWAGLRPLIHEGGKSPSEMSRKDEIFISESGLISIAGGKLTGYRKMAEKVVNLVAKIYERKFEIKFSSCKTADIPLSGGPFGSQKEVDAYTREIEHRLTEQYPGLEEATYLVCNYGKQAEMILEKMKEFNTEPFQALICAEVWFAIFFEMALYPADFFSRRSGRLFFNFPSIGSILEIVLADFAHYLDWDETTLSKERAALERLFLETTHFV